ncbi:hypothetical protein PS838_03636 [Pseudomonas fluorescens]|nr:hypothetical protein PS838_03636 [Pseudomonas fluorescens]
MLLPGDILPIGTVSVVESFNLRGDFDLFSFWLMLDGCGGGARGGMLVSLWEIGEGCGFFDLGLGGLRADQVLVGGVHIRCCGNGRLGFRPYGESLLANAPKGTKRSRPGVRPLAKARGSFAPVSIRGHCPPVCFATTYMQRVRLRRTALRATPRMNTSTQPPEGAGGSRSRAAGELTLGLMSGEKRRCTRPPVGASLLAMVVNDNACLLVKRGAIESIASKLAPTIS